ncbi:hypothetical protein [Bacillus cereus]|uniref:hypothetical protein n=1 Tax=Bacillus cereus TaxID=1396 RepID=UPI000BFA2047|nr:hypothetical protein [Bacillus cereus]PFT36097.1 hypothetical protein COK71_09810 [Bacillus cereus]
MVQECQRIIHEFEEDFFQEAEVGFGKYIEIVNTESSLNLADWETIILSRQEIFSLVEYIRTYNNKQLDPSTIQTLEELKRYLHTIKTDLAELATFKPDVIHLAEEDPCYFDGEPEVFEVALQTAMNRVAEQQSEIIDKMHDKKGEIKNALQRIPTLLEQLITSLKNHKSHTNSEDINNTGLPSLIISDRD